MATPPELVDSGESLFDSAHPFKGVVVCCTSIPTELRSDIAAKTAELGGVHKYDLTPDCTHLIVGEYDTPKYRHVAKERPDVKPMAAGWVEAVRNLWVQDAEIDFVALEKEWQLRTFETGGGEPIGNGAVANRRKLLCCMTGFEEPDLRQQITEKIESNGGVYTGDLTKRVTHLIVYKPEGRKYQAAKNWGVQTVSIEWVNDSVERGLILDEKCYDPILPKEERGLGAWNRQKPLRVSSLGKRLRENSAAQEEGKRKLRKTASMKLNSQRDNLWGDILGKPQPPQEPSSGGPSRGAATSSAAAPPAQPSQPAGGSKSMDTQGSKLSSIGAPDHNAIFASCCFFVHGFSAQKTEILINAVASLGGLVCHSLDEVVSTSGAQLAHRFLILPQTSPTETHPQLPPNVHIITEFYIERCLHKKYFFDPSQHVIGRPFPVFPISGFEDLVICTAGFAGVDLNQVDKSIRQLGAKYQERFTADVSILVVCSSLSAVRKEKLESALAWKVPVISAEWLWECISTGSRASIAGFLYPELRQNIDCPKLPTGRGKDGAKAKQGASLANGAVDKDPLSKQVEKTKPARGSDGVTTGPVNEPRPSTRKGAHATEHDSNLTTSMHFETALTHQFQTNGTNSASTSMSNKHIAPLTEASFNSLNKTPPSPRKQSRPQPRTHKPLSRITSEVADSEATEGDVCQPSDLPAEDDLENQPDNESEPAAEETRRRVDAEKTARASAEAERLALSTKLVNSLLDSAAAPVAVAGGGDGGDGAGGNGPTSLFSMIANNDIGGGDDAITTSTTATATYARPPTRRRKREILGRAVSNVSAVSAISTTSSASGGGGGGGGEPANNSKQPAPGAMDRGAADHAIAGLAGGGLPAATQLEYEDPEAKRYKAQLMSKMLGNKDKGASFPAGDGVERQAHKLSLAEMGGYDLPMMQQGLDGDATGGRGERRTTRRRLGTSGVGK
ncbi:S-M checkpoint control protein rad4 [Madurella mycetomatis]|uniref:S-M checkpoint control protein rad4 n=1 Tax=Madurella mycetomatis TaxID=100816 RepID=A0A175WGM6_9PEZI|nr:S-M checkpoint control protein rad4 [Madurella mycetomatis]